MIQDVEFEQYIQGDAELSKLYADTPEIELPDHLDAAILAEAHRAVNARPGAKVKRRWTIPLGMVATLFVAVMIGMQLPYMLPEAAKEPTYKKEEVAQRMSDNTSAEVFERKKTLAMAPLSSNDITRKSAAGRSEQLRDEPAMMSPEKEASSKAYAPPLPSTVVLPQAPASVMQRSQLRESKNIDNGLSLSKAKESVVPRSMNVGDSLESPAPRATMAAPVPEELDVGAMPSKLGEAEVSNLSAEDWLKRIKKLKQAGKQEEAKKDLTAFKKSFPTYAIPKELDLP